MRSKLTKALTLRQHRPQIPFRRESEEGTAIMDLLHKGPGAGELDQKRPPAKQKPEKLRRQPGEIPA